MRLPAVLLVLAALAAVAPGCTDVADSGAPFTGACVVSGRVSFWPGFQDDVRVSFVGVGDQQLIVHAYADAGGAFRVELPPGRYLPSVRADWRDFYLTPAGEVTSSRSETDTLRLEEGQPPRELVFRMGALRLRATGLAGLEGYAVRAEATLADVSNFFGDDSYSNEVHVVGGAVNLLVGPLPAGDYVTRVSLRANGNQNGDEFWLPGVAAREDATVHHVEPDSLVVVYLPLSASPARVSGRVGGAWLEMGLAEPSLVAVDADSNRVAGPWRIRQDGTFELVFGRPVPVRLAVEFEGLYHWLGGPGFGEATNFDLAAGESITGQDVDVSGVLVRADRAGVVESYFGARVELTDPVTRRIVQSFGVHMEAADAVACVLPGQYLVRLLDYSAARGTWRPQWYDRAATADEAALVTVPDAGGTLVLDFVLEPGAGFAGTVDFTGTMAEYARVVLASADEATVVAADFTAPMSPWFAFTGLVAGRYRLGVVGSSSRVVEGAPVPVDAVWYPGSVGWQEAEVFTVAGADSVVGLLLVVP